MKRITFRLITNDDNDSSHYERRRVLFSSISRVVLETGYYLAFINSLNIILFSMPYSFVPNDFKNPYFRATIISLRKQPSIPNTHHYNV